MSAPGPGPPVHRRALGGPSEGAPRPLIGGSRCPDPTEAPGGATRSLRFCRGRRRVANPDPRIGVGREPGICGPGHGGRGQWNACTEKQHRINPGRPGSLSVWVPIPSAHLSGPNKGVCVRAGVNSLSPPKSQNACVQLLLIVTGGCPVKGPVPTPLPALMLKTRKPQFGGQLEESMEDGGVGRTPSLLCVFLLRGWARRSGLQSVPAANSQFVEQLSECKCQKYVKAGRWRMRFCLWG